MFLLLAKVKENFAGRTCRYQMQLQLCHGQNLSTERNEIVTFDCSATAELPGLVCLNGHLERKLTPFEVIELHSPFCVITEINNTRVALQLRCFFIWVNRGESLVNISTIRFRLVESKQPPLLPGLHLLPLVSNNLTRFFVTEPKVLQVKMDLIER